MGICQYGEKGKKRMKRRILLTIVLFVDNKIDGIIQKIYK